MNPKKRALRVGAVFIGLLIIGGLLLMYKGNDAIQMGMEKKEGILTAEQVKMSFDSVNGRLVNLAVKEGDEVKAGDVVMELDSTDTDLAIEKLEAQIAQLDAQIRSTSGSQDTGDTESLSLPTIAQERASAANMSNDVDSLVQQRQALAVQLKQLQVSKERLTLRAPEDGKVIKVLAKEGEMISQNTPVILLESKRSYYDIYISEKQAQGLSEGDTITGTTVAGGKKVTGTIQLLTKAPEFADLKQSREKGQADLTAFQVRIFIDPKEGVAPGMTIGVKDSEFAKR
ncbi:MAG: biotin/lipoyl-binding protein [Selenomonadaceae bacterium]|nr:biotin/lipoyl-binding protein [Selenomonadaceae bacterium]MDY2684694.1 biotin/lipoyl-binding protein [Selenomonadaceae bacterium]